MDPSPPKRLFSGTSKCDSSVETATKRTAANSQMESLFTRPISISQQPTLTSRPLSSVSSVAATSTMSVAKPKDSTITLGSNVESLSACTPIVSSSSLYQEKLNSLSKKYKFVVVDESHNNKEELSKDQFVHMFKIPSFSEQRQIKAQEGGGASQVSTNSSASVVPNGITINRESPEPFSSCVSLAIEPSVRKANVSMKKEDNYIFITQNNLVHEILILDQWNCSSLRTELERFLRENNFPVKPLGQVLIGVNRKADRIIMVKLCNKLMQRFMPNNGTIYRIEVCVEPESINIILREEIE